MIRSSDFVKELVKYGTNVFTGVPCSFLEPIISYCLLSEELNYYTLNNEGECIAFACGTYMAGKIPAVLIQNSGLGNCINPLTSLVYPYQFPFLIICGWRGHEGVKDEIQHKLMGEITEKLFNNIKIEYCIASDNYKEEIKTAYEHMNKTQLPFAILIKQDTFYKSSKKEKNIKNNISSTILSKEKYACFTREKAIRKIVSLIKDDMLVVASTGYISRDLYNICDRTRNFYVLGSMGCASSVALGLCISNPNIRCVIIEGDGSALMRLEHFASIGHYKPQNLIHIILDNEIHDSTGGQPTISQNISFTGIARACGYQAYFFSNAEEKFVEDLKIALANNNGPVLIHLKLYLHSITKLRPGILPYELKNRLIKSIN